MTDPEEREEAKNHAAEGLERARMIRERGDTIGERWRKSQADNNFRLMLRSIGKATGSE